MTPLVPPTRRSRNGCIDCRRAKVKCDEIRPSCGTCARRRHVCQGYKTPPARHAQASLLAGGDGSSSIGSGSGGGGSSLKGKAVVAVTGGSGRSSKTTPTAGVTSSTASPDSGRPVKSPRSLALIPPGTVSAADEPHIYLYFNRHPFELLIGNEFVSEMNANVLLMLQQDPVTVSDAISAIGYSYLMGDSSEALLPVLNRRARILANLRSMKPSSYYFEEALFLLLGLCAMELVTLAQPGHHATIPTVLSNVASLISHHVSTGGDVSSVARYYLRALARQDLVVSLVQLRRPRVPAHVWLDDECCRKPDRLLGYTMTLMPLLQELCTLAEEMREQVLQPVDFTSSSGASSAPFVVEGDHPPEQPVTGAPLGLDAGWLDADYSSTALRADSLRMRLEGWRPAIADADTTLPFRASRKFRAQAACYRAGALLYLHRLFRPPGSGADADAEALSRAHDLMLYATGPPAETKLLLWPVFLAACEMDGEEDRASVLEVFEAICAHRKTVTVDRTRGFVEERVWRARDEVRDWNWMRMAQEFPGECLPI